MKPLRKSAIGIIPCFIAFLVLAGIIKLQGQSQAPPNSGRTGLENVVASNAFSADSARAFEWHEKALQANRAGDWNTSREYVQASILLFDQLIEQTSDSLIWEKYIMVLFDWAMWNGLHYQDLQGALRTFEKGYRLSLEHFGETYPNLSFFIMKIGHIYGLMGDYETSLVYRRRAFEHRLKYMAEEDFFYLGGYLNMIAGLYGEENLEERLSYIEKAKRLIEKYYRGSPEEPLIYCWYGWTYKDMGKYDLAMDYFRIAQKMAVEIDNPLSLATVLQSMGEIYLEKGDFDRALPYYYSVLELREEQYGTTHPAMAHFYCQISDLLIEDQNYEEALDYAKKALRASAKQVDDETWESGSLSGVLYESITSIHALHNRAITLSALSKKENDPKKLEFALESMETLFEQVDHMFQLYKSEHSRISICAVQNAWIEDAIDIALQLFEQKRDSSYLVKAFQFSEKGKAYSLLRQVKIAQERAESPIPQDLKESDRKIRTAIKEMEKKIAEAQITSELVYTPEILKLETILFKLKKQQDSLILANQEKYPHFWRLKQNLYPPTIANVQQKLAPGDCLLQYYHGEKNIYLFRITPNEIKYFRIAVDSSLIATIETIKTELQPNKKSSHDFLASSALIYRRLVHPALEGSSIEKLKIIPDGFLNYIPFEILLTAEVNPENNPGFRRLPYLFKELPVSYEYSCALLLEHSKAPVKAGKYLGVAPQYSNINIAERTGPDSLYVQSLFRNVRSGLSPLEHNIPEIMTVRNSLSGECLAGTAATEENFKGKVQEFDILHLAMHAHTNDLDPDFSWLIFSNPNMTNADTAQEDGFLHAYEITNMELKAQLAVLSACNTGAGRLSRGEGVLSLARAFKYAGCSNIVMSLWPANDVSTESIITSFFEYLKDGLDKDEALRQAKLGFLQSTPNESLAHPFYWSGFILVGDDAPVRFAHTQRYWFSWAAVAFLMAGILALFLRTGGLTKSYILSIIPKLFQNKQI